MAVLSMDVGSQEQLLMLDQSSPCLGWTSRGQWGASKLLLSHPTREELKLVCGKEDTNGRLVLCRGVCVCV